MKDLLRVARIGRRHVVETEGKSGHSADSADTGWGTRKNDLMQRNGSYFGFRFAPYRV